MSKRNKTVFGIITGVVVVLLIIGGILLYQKKQSNIELKLVQAVFSQLSQKQVAFDGAIETNQQPKLNIEFQTVVNNGESQTSFTLQPSGSNDEAKASGEVIVANNQEYLKITDVDKLINQLPKDPLSNAIKANILTLADKYQRKWIILDEDNPQQNIGGCLANFSEAQYTPTQIADAYKKQPFIENLVRQGGDEGSLYTFKVNGNINSFLSQLNHNTTNCKLEGVEFTISVDNTSQPLQIGARNDSGMLTLKNFKNLSAKTHITEPKAQSKFSDLKKETNALFIP